MYGEIKLLGGDYLCFILMKKIKSITKIQYMARLVIGNCKNGIFIRLENNDVAYAPFGYLQKGIKVLCTLYRKAQKNKNAYVCVDTVFCDSKLTA